LNLSKSGKLGKSAKLPVQRHPHPKPSQPFTSRLAASMSPIRNEVLHVGQRLHLLESRLCLLPLGCTSLQASSPQPPSFHRGAACKVVGVGPRTTRSCNSWYYLQLITSTCWHSFSVHRGAAERRRLVPSTTRPAATLPVNNFAFKNTVPLHAVPVPFCRDCRAGPQTHAPAQLVST
jgi:hypothetical protein